jgi:hypothetical protein
MGGANHLGTARLGSFLQRRVGAVPVQSAEGEKNVSLADGFSFVRLVAAFLVMLCGFCVCLTVHAAGLDNIELCPWFGWIAAFTGAGLVTGGLASAVCVFLGVV